MKKTFKIISRVLLILVIVLIVLIFIIPQFLSIFFGKDIKPNNGISICEQNTSLSLKGECLFDVALKQNKESICEHIPSFNYSIRDYDKYLKASCLASVAVQKQDTIICEKIEEYEQHGYGVWSCKISKETCRDGVKNNQKPLCVFEQP